MEKSRGSTRKDADRIGRKRGGRYNPRDGAAAENPPALDLQPLSGFLAADFRGGHDPLGAEFLAVRPSNLAVKSYFGPKPVQQLRQCWFNSRRLVASGGQ